MPTAHTLCLQPSVLRKLKGRSKQHISVHTKFFFFFFFQKSTTQLDLQLSPLKHYSLALKGVSYSHQLINNPWCDRGVQQIHRVRQTRRTPPQPLPPSIMPTPSQPHSIHYTKRPSLSHLVPLHYFLLSSQVTLRGAPSHTPLMGCTLPTPQP